MAAIQDRWKDAERQGQGLRWRVRYRTPDGQQRAKSFRTQDAAKKFAASVETAKAGGTFVDPQQAGMSVAEWVATWLNSKANLKASTAERYAGIVREHIDTQLSRVKLADLRHEGVQAWLNSIDRSPATVRKAHRVLSQALDYAVKSRRLALNPAKGVSLPRVVSAERRYLTHQQVEHLAAEVGPEWALIVQVLAYTGLRWGELAALRVERVNLLRRRIEVAESVTPVKGVMTFGTPKSHEKRLVPVPKFLVPALERHMATKRPGDLLFQGPRGGVLRAQTFQRAALNAAAEAMGLCSPKLADDGTQATVRRSGGAVPVWTEHFHPHEFRHTAASLAIASGADVKVVQQMLGHKSATMTLDLYGHLFPDRLDVVADAMDAARLAALTRPAVGV